MSDHKTDEIRADRENEPVDLERGGCQTPDCGDGEKGDGEKNDGNKSQLITCKYQPVSEDDKRSKHKIISVEGLKLAEDDTDVSFPYSTKMKEDKEAEDTKLNENNNQLERLAIVAPKAEFEVVDLDEYPRSKDLDSTYSERPDVIGGMYDDTDAPQIETLTVRSKDEPDAASVFSLFMERDFRYYFQHPYFRLFLAYFVTICNFLIYAEDPVAHSIKESTIPVIGNDFAFVCTRYPPNAWSLLKVFLWLTGILIGMVVGKVVVHSLLFNKLLRLKMFHDDQGSWLVMFLVVMLTLFVTSYVYNGFLLIGGDYTVPFKVSDLMGITNSWFMKAAACGTWCGDFFTAWMVTDMMLQEKLYPGWAKPVRTWWVRRYHRIILFWVITLVTSFVVIFTISTDYISWDTLNHDLLQTNEMSRSFLASFILVCDMMIVMQDWDFPYFISAIDIKLPGLNTSHIEFDIPKCLKRESWHFHITGIFNKTDQSFLVVPFQLVVHNWFIKGRWFNYGILFFVILLDLNMWKNQIFYQPFDYGQYTDIYGRIHTVLDKESLLMYNITDLSYDFRNSTINPTTNKTYITNDSIMNSRFYDYSLPIKSIAFIPSIAGFLLFGILIWMYGRFKPTKEDPYAGRLKKRRKSWRRFSARFQWKKLRNRIRNADPILTYFKSRSNRCTNIEENSKQENDSDSWRDNKGSVDCDN